MEDSDVVPEQYETLTPDDPGDPDDLPSEIVPTWCSGNQGPAVIVRDVIEVEKQVMGK